MAVLIVNAIKQHEMSSKNCVSEVDSFEYEFEYKWVDVEEMY